MSNVASLFRLALSAAALLVVAQPAVQAAELHCSDQAVTARGPEFHPSPEQSAEAAKTEWLKQALAIYSDATWDTAKDPKMTCVNQGLYSNCRSLPCPAAWRPQLPKQIEASLILHSTTLQ